MQGRYDNGYSSSGSNNYSSSGSGGYPTNSNYGSSIGGSVPSAPQQYVDVSSTGPVVPPANSYSSTYTPTYYPQTQTSSNLFGGYNARVRAQHANQQVVDSKYEHCCTIV